MSENEQGAAAGNQPDAGEGFTWHPTYAGKSFARVHSDLMAEIGRDQRSYRLAMEGAEASEHDSLTTVVELERRWSTYDFDWTETDPRALADRILTFEKERERRRESISFADYRASGALVQQDRPTVATPARSIPVLPIGIAILALLLIVLAWIIFN